MGNIHGHRLNMDVLTSKGSGFVAHTAPISCWPTTPGPGSSTCATGRTATFIFSTGTTSKRAITGDPKIWDRSNGRIYKISYRDTKPVTDVDLRRKSDQELVQLVLDRNEWYVRHARRLLQERAANRQLAPDTRDALARLAFTHASEPGRLRLLWRDT